MKEELVQRNGDAVVFEQLQNFQKTLHEKPKQIKRFSQGNTSFDYVPIGQIEMQLDEMYSGIWETINFKAEPLGNEIRGQIELRVFHPLAKIWITRTGVAAVQVRFAKDSDILDIRNKVKNALQMDFPHLYAECLKNAAQSLGKQFGRDLRRDTVVNYQPESIFPPDEKLSLELEQRLSAFTDANELKGKKDKIFNEFVEKGLGGNFVKAQINKKYKGLVK